MTLLFTFLRWLLTYFPVFLICLSFLATQVFASHSLWHLCVLGAVYVSFHFLIQYQALLKDHGCAAYGYSSVTESSITCDTSAGNGTCTGAY